MPKILVIDDEKSVRSTFVSALSEDGYVVETAASGKEGITKAQALQPDLIFLGLRMPEMDGVEALRLLQGPGSCCAHIPVYIVTAFQKQFFDLLQKAIAEGYTFCIANKPLSDEQIRTVARATLEGAAVVETPL